MKKITIFYWIFTGLLSVLITIGAIPDIMRIPEAVAMVETHLGYPPYLLPFLGVAKISGIVAILIPGFPRIKEWAYAGLTFDLAGAIYSHISVGDPANVWMPIIVGFVLIFGSYIFYHKKLKTALLTNKN